MNREVARVPFHGMDILTIKENDEIYVAMRDVCNGLGVDWSAQRQRIMRHEVLSTCVVKMTTQVFDDLYQGAMFMTEQGAGSDVGATATRATPDGDDTPQRDIATIYGNLPEPELPVGLLERLVDRVESGAWD